MTRYRWQPGSWTLVTDGRPTITSAVARNRLARIQWVAPAGVTITSTTVTATATGQATVNATVSGATTSVVLDGIVPLDADGGQVTWDVEVACTDSCDTVHTVSAQVIPQMVKPNSNITGVPVGATGDIRTPVTGGYAGLTPITAATMTSTLTQTAGATITGYDVDCTVSGVFLYAHDITFRNCRFNGINTNALPQVGTNGGGVWRRVTFIDCEFNGQGTTTLAGGVAANTGFNGSTPAAHSFIRCHLHGLTDTSNNLVGEMRHCYLHDLVYRPGSNPPATETHNDVWQWFTVGAHAGLTFGPVVIQGNTAVATAPETNAIMHTGPFPGADPNDRFTGFLFERNWCDGPAGYLFSGLWPSGQDQSQVVFRGNKFGLNVGQYGMFYPGWRGGVTWGGDNTWELTGTNNLGQSVTAGQVIS